MNDYILPEKLGAIFRQARKSKGLYMSDVAKGAGCSENTVGNVERAAHKASYDTIFKIAKFLDINPFTMNEAGVVEDVDYIVKQSLDQKQPASSKKQVLERDKRTWVDIHPAAGSTYRVGDTGAHLEGGNLVVGIVEALSNGETHFSNHDGEELFFCLAGEIIVTINKAEILLKKGDCVLFRAYEPHSYKSNIAKESVGLSVISGSGAKNISELHTKKKIEDEKKQS